jgi:LuxR family transcriptional regulator, maltose regulon positive regulatory protein
VGLGGLLHEHLRFDEAETALQRGLEIGRRWGSPEIQIGALFSLARLRFTQGNLEGAQSIIDQLEASYANALPALERNYIQTLRARFWLAQGQLVKAWSWAGPLLASQPIPAQDEPCLLVLARVLLARHETERAKTLLDGLETAARASTRNSLIEILLLKVLNPATPQQIKTNNLIEALTLAAPQNQRRVFVDEAELLQPLQAYHDGHPEDPFAASLLQDFERRAAAMHAPLQLLSEREMDVLRLIAAGLPNQEIADRLVVALSTVKSHVKSILTKLDVDNRTSAVAQARALGLL